MCQITRLPRPFLPGGANEWGAGAKAGPDRFGIGPWAAHPRPTCSGRGTHSVGEAFTPTESRSGHPQPTKTHGWYNGELPKHSHSPHTHNKDSGKPAHLGFMAVYGPPRTSCTHPPIDSNHLWPLAICLPGGPLPGRGKGGAQREGRRS